MATPAGGTQEPELDWLSNIRQERRPQHECRRQERRPTAARTTNIPQDSQSQPPHWRFPPNEGGAEQGTNPGQKHFSSNVFTNMVREVLQNSLDHHQPGLNGVQVTFKTLSIQGTDIQASQLLKHVRASLHERNLQNSQT